MTCCERLSAIEKKLVQLGGENGKFLADYREGVIKKDDWDRRLAAIEKRLDAQKDAIIEMELAQNVQGESTDEIEEDLDKIFKRLSAIEKRLEFIEKFQRGQTRDAPCKDWSAGP